MALAGLEFSLGFLLIIIFKNINKSLEFDDKKKHFKNFCLDSNTKIYISQLKYGRVNINDPRIKKDPVDTTKKKDNIFRKKVT